MLPTRILLDIDPGVDDALALLLALASPEIRLESLTTTQGNVTLEKATRNALSLLELSHADHIPVASGSNLSLVQPLRASQLSYRPGTGWDYTLHRGPLSSFGIEEAAQFF